MQAVENDRNTKWNHRKENKSNQIPGKDVCAQANRKRKQTSRMANDLNWHHQGSEKRHRADEMLQVLEHSVLADPLQIVEAECAQGATERHGRCGSCGRLKTRYQPYQVAEKNEKPQGSEKRNKALAMVTYDFLGLITDEPVNALQDVL